MCVGEGVRGLETRGALFAAEIGKLTKSLVRRRGGVQNGQRSNFYIKLKGVLIFRRGTVYPNSHTDFENSDKISARPHLEYENHDKV